MTDTREKLIELLKQAPFEGKVLDEWWWEDKIARIADYLVVNGVTVPDKNVGKWIPVTERLPEDDKNIRFYDDGRLRGTTVLVYTEYGRTIPNNRLLVRATGNEWLDTQVTDGWEWSRGTGKVTHWMPLPSPPSTEVSE